MALRARGEPKKKPHEHVRAMFGVRECEKRVLGSQLCLAQDVDFGAWCLDATVLHVKVFAETFV